jgi:hypothetical protein
MQCFCKLRRSLLLPLCCLTDNERFLASVQLLPQTSGAKEDVKLQNDRGS